jgi:hypothetical protein
MNTTQLMSRRFVVGMGPRLTAPVRFSSTAMKPKDRTFMRAIFTTGTVVTAGGVLYGVSLLHVILEMLPIDFSKRVTGEDDPHG